MTRRVRGPRGAARPAPMPVNHRCPPSHVARLRSTCAFVEAQVTEQDPQHPTRYRTVDLKTQAFIPAYHPAHSIDRRTTAVSLSSRISIHRHLPTSPSIFHIASCIHLARMLHLQPALNTRLVAGAARRLLCHAQLRSQHVRIYLEYHIKGSHTPGRQNESCTRYVPMSIHPCWLIRFPVLSRPWRALFTPSFCPLG